MRHTIALNSFLIPLTNIPISPSPFNSSTSLIMLPALNGGSHSSTSHSSSPFTHRVNSNFLDGSSRSICTNENLRLFRSAERVNVSPSARYLSAPTVRSSTVCSFSSDTCCLRERTSSARIFWTDSSREASSSSLCLSLLPMCKLAMLRSTFACCRSNSSFLSATFSPPPPSCSSSSISPICLLILRRFSLSASCSSLSCLAAVSFASLAASARDRCFATQSSNLVRESDIRARREEVKPGS
mmetsp:Transcript_38846/g.116784  ORF Transcript_38846/g.116784 Transcript_38846/m.116784 type:complete len:242 (-) Transcript_38846:319-1044(-)